MNPYLLTGYNFKIISSNWLQAGEILKRLQSLWIHYTQQGLARIVRMAGPLETCFYDWQVMLVISINGKVVKKTAHVIINTFLHTFASDGEE